MGYKILGINVTHNGSVCILDDGKIIFFLEEERVSRYKNDDFAFKVILKYISKNYQIDEIAISGLSHHWCPKSFSLYKFFINSLFPNTTIQVFLKDHHLSHAASSFFNSNFKKCLGVVIDANGSIINSPNNEEIAETESIYILDYKNPPTCLYKSNRLVNKNEKISLVQVYECVTEGIGFKWGEAGKTMGLSSYGKPNSQIPPLYLGTKGNPLVFNNILGNVTGYLKKEYHHLVATEELKQDLAFAVQQESQQAVGDLIEKSLKKTGLTQVCCSGGYFFNCVANYYLTKRFPNVKFYFEPISGDAGVSIGAAKIAWYNKTQDKTIRPQKTLYYGPKYTKEQLLEGIQKYLD